MKKLIAFIISAVAVFSIGCTVLADEGINVVVNGEAVDFTGDQAPVIQEGRTLVPFRRVFEKMGAKVEWIDDIKLCRASYGGITCDIEIGSTTVHIGDSSTVESDVPPQIINGRTMVPLRVLSEVLGADVEWDNATKTVSVTPPAVYEGDLPKNLELIFADKSITNTDKNSTVTYAYPVFSDKVPFAALKKLNNLIEEDAKSVAAGFSDTIAENTTIDIECEILKQGEIISVTYMTDDGVVNVSYDYNIKYGARTDNDKLEQLEESEEKTENAEKAEVYNYIIKELQEEKTAPDGRAYITYLIQCPEFDINEDIIIPDGLNSLISIPVLKDAQDFIESYSDTADEYYKKHSSELTEAPYTYTSLCEVEIDENGIATITNHIVKTLYDENEKPIEESGTEVIKADLNTGIIIE